MVLEPHKKEQVPHRKEQVVHIQYWVLSMKV